MQRLNLIGVGRGIILCLAAIFANGATGSVANISSLYEDAVRFQVSHDARLLVADHYRSLSAKGADQAEIDVEPRMIEVSGEPWLAGVAVVIRIPKGRVTPATLRNLLLASYSSQGFDVNGRSGGLAPFADIQVTVLPPGEANPQIVIDWAEVTFPIAIGVALGCLGLGLFLRLRRSANTGASVNLETERRIPESLLSFEGSWDIRALLDAPPTELRYLFRTLPFQEALQILSQLDPPARGKVLDNLRIQTAVRQRLEERLRRIYAKA